MWARGGNLLQVLQWMGIFGLPESPTNPVLWSRKHSLWYPCIGYSVFLWFKGLVVFSVINQEPSSSQHCWSAILSDSTGCGKLCKINPNWSAPRRIIQWPALLQIASDPHWPGSDPFKLTRRTHPKWYVVFTLSYLSDSMPCFVIRSTWMKLTPCLLLHALGPMSFQELKKLSSVCMKSTLHDLLTHWPLGVWQ